MKPRILFLVPATYEALVAKGVEWMIRERDEAGFFERVVTVHPLADQTRTIDLDAVHRIYEMGLGRGVAAVWRAAVAVHRLVQIARAERIDLVRATDPYVMGLFGWCVARALAVPFCVSVHTDYRAVFALSPPSLAGRLRRLMASVLPAFVLSKADLVLPIREHLSASLVAAGADPARIRIIPHGVDMTPFREPLPSDAREMFGLPSALKVISFVGRLAPENYVADMTRAIARVVADRRDVVFVIAGEGPEAPLVHRLIGSLPDPEVVRLLPFQSHDRIVALRRISSGSLCLMAGFSLIEACAAASPPVAYDVAWHRELVRNGETGYLVAEHDVTGVVTAINRLLDDPASAAAMGQQARQLAWLRHDRRLTSQIKRDLYAELLSRREGVRP